MAAGLQQQGENRVITCMVQADSVSEFMNHFIAARTGLQIGFSDPGQSCFEAIRCSVNLITMVK